MRIFLALPCLNESENIGAFLSCIREQSFTDFELFVCVNQPDHWWEEPVKKHVCVDNQRTLERLHQCQDVPITVIDRSSPGKGWKGNHFGVGWARKTVMDAINEKANGNNIIVSIDADTTFKEAYLESIQDNFIRHPDFAGLAVPYYHLLTDDEVTDRCILRYEIYMRYFALNMWRIANPYRFTAIGSAMAFSVWAYRAVGGITPHKSGEDFYFMQKLAKYGRIMHWNSERIYPAARFSDRVLFGTGPAMIKGREGDWSSYPIYPFQLFNDIMITYDLFPSLYERDLTTPMSGYLKTAFKTNNIWQPLRRNYKTREQFVRACINRVDGLRILQYLKSRHRKTEQTDEKNLREYFTFQYQKAELAPPFRRESKEQKFDLEAFDFALSPVSELDAVRNFLAEKEEAIRCNDVRDVAM